MINTTFSTPTNPSIRSARPEKKDAAPAGDGFVSTKSLPSADFDTNLAKLKAASLKVKSDPVTEALNQFKQEQQVNEQISNRDVNQTAFQNDLIGKLGGEHARMQFSQDVSQLNGSIPTMSQLNAMFDKLKAREDIPFEYIIDGCYARAHLMSEQMSSEGMNNAKMFCMVANPWGSGKLTAENKYMEAKWWYHVAPLVFAYNGATEKVEGYIMDPSMDTKPMKAEEWIGKMWDEQTNIKVDVTRAPQYGPIEAGGVNQTFEESLAPSHEILAEYSKVLAEIKEQWEANHPPQNPPAQQPPAEQPPVAA